jgi:hypothetical protein
MRGKTQRFRRTQLECTSRDCSVMLMHTSLERHNCERLDTIDRAGLLNVHRRKFIRRSALASLDKNFWDDIRFAPVETSISNSQCGKPVAVRGVGKVPPNAQWAGVVHVSCRKMMLTRKD